MASPTDYSCVPAASITVDFLHTNSTSHKFAFGAIAELVDNAQDANALTVRIDMYKDMHNPGLHRSFGYDCMRILDDGTGMTRDGSEVLMAFGLSGKMNNEDSIGQYGNGLKSSSMSLAQDMLVFTRRDGQCTIVMLSRTFLERCGIRQTVYTPTVTFKADMLPYNIMTAGDGQAHDKQIHLIHKYSPFHDMDMIKEQFDEIGEHGTAVWLCDLRPQLDGRPAMMVRGVDDIVLAEEGDVSADNSLRAYLAILYRVPRMHTVLQGAIVQTHIIERDLAYARKYDTQFKLPMSRQAEMIDKTAEAMCAAEHSLQLSQDRHGQVRMTLTTMKRDDPKYEATAGEVQLLARDLNQKRTLHERATLGFGLARKSKAATEVPRLSLVLGLNVLARAECGSMIYNNGRLILMNKHPKQQASEKIRLWGVCCVVDIPFCSLTPTHNKQDFTDASTMRRIFKEIDKHYETYWTNHIATQQQPLDLMWRKLGYGADFLAMPVVTNDVLRTRAILVPSNRQCANCHKWRYLTRADMIIKLGDRPFVCDMLGENDRTCANGDDGHHRIVSGETVVKTSRSPRQTVAAHRAPPTMPTTRRGMAATTVRRNAKTTTTKKRTIESDDEEEDEDDAPPILRRRRRRSPSPSTGSDEGEMPTSPIATKTESDAMPLRYNTETSTILGDGSVHEALYMKLMDMHPGNDAYDLKSKMEMQKMTTQELGEHFHVHIKEYIMSIPKQLKHSQ